MWVGMSSLHTSLKQVYTFYCYVVLTVDIYVLLEGEIRADKFQIPFKLRCSIMSESIMLPRKSTPGPKEDAKHQTTPA